MPTYTMPEWILLVGAIGVMVQGIITAYRTTAKLNTMTNDLSATRTELVSVAKTAEVTLGHVNSQTTKATAEIQALTAERATLKATVEDMKHTAALLAQALAASAAHGDRRNGPPAPSFPITSGLPSSGPAALPIVIKEEDLPLVIQPEVKKKGK